MYAEPLPSGFGFSDTAFRVFILMVSRRLESDRFFTTGFRPEVYTQTGIDWVTKTKMKDVLLRHYPQLEPALEGLPNAFPPWHQVRRTAAGRPLPAPGRWRAAGARGNQLVSVSQGEHLLEADAAGAACPRRRSPRASMRSGRASCPPSSAACSCPGGSDEAPDQARRRQASRGDAVEAPPKHGGQGIRLLGGRLVVLWGRGRYGRFWTSPPTCTPRTPAPRPRVAHFSPTRSPSPAARSGDRRDFSEAVLAKPERVHPFGERFVAVAGEEVRRLDLGDPRAGRRGSGSSTA